MKVYFPLEKDIHFVDGNRKEEQQNKRQREAIKPHLRWEGEDIAGFRVRSELGRSQAARVGGG